MAGRRLTRYLFEELAGRPLVEGEVIRHSLRRAAMRQRMALSTRGVLSTMCRTWFSASVRRAVNGMAWAQLTEEQVRDIRALARDHDLRGDLAFVARAYGVSPAALPLVLKGETWVDVT
jgi:hypothetical protein